MDAVLMGRTRVRGLTFFVVILLFLASEATRTSDVRAATLLSMLGWLLFAVFAILTDGVDRGWTGVLRGLGCVLVTSLLAGGVLLLYFHRSRILEAGPMTDAVWTYLGLKWFVELHNPITFAGATPSYHQFGLSLLSHLPALVVGFARLGAFAPFLGLMLQIGVLLAFTARRMQSGRLGAQLFTAALAAGVFSNRALVLCYDKVGYSVPAVCLGLMLVEVVAAGSMAEVERPIGMLVTLAVMHHYTGLTFALPVCLAWVVVGRQPLHRLRTFAARNPTLLLAMAVLLVTIAIHPGLLMQRVWDVTTQSQTHVVDSLLTKARQSWPYLKSSFPSVWYAAFVTGAPASWHLLSVPPLGGLTLAVSALTWVLSCWAVPGRRVRAALLFASFGALLLLLTVVQHLLSDFADRRDITAVYAMMVAGLLFVFRAPVLEGRSRFVATAVAVMICVYNYVDVGGLEGQRYGDVRAPISQHTMESLRTLLRKQDARVTGVRSLYVVVEEFFPLESLYVDSLEKRYGVRIRLVRAPAYCEGEGAAITKILAEECDDLLILSDARYCSHGIAQGSATAGGLTAVRYPRACGDAGAGGPDRPSLRLAL